MLSSSFVDDFLYGGKDNNKLYDRNGDDLVIGGLDSDYFDFDVGVDVIYDFSLDDNNDESENCGVIYILI